MTYGRTLVTEVDSDGLSPVLSMTAEVYATDEAGSLAISQAAVLFLLVLHQFKPVSHDKTHMSHDCHTSHYYMYYMTV